MVMAAFLCAIVGCVVLPIVALAAEISSGASHEQAWWGLSLPLLASMPSLEAGKAAMLLTALALIWICTMMIYWAAPGGNAWGRLPRPSSIPGPRGWPVIGCLMDMSGLAHVRLAELASACSARSLMAFSLGDTRVILTSVPDVAREILNSSAFADRPIKASARQLLFDRAIGFAPFGSHWRNLRRIAATHLFMPKRIAAHEHHRQHETTLMLNSIDDSMSLNGVVPLRMYLQRASLNNIMGSVFGRTYDFGRPCQEADKLQAMVREGFDLLGAVNWADHLSWFGGVFDLLRIKQRCDVLVADVKEFVQRIINEHKMQKSYEHKSDSDADFVDALLALDDSEKLSDADMIAVLWEMVFRGTDTTAILTEWILAEIILHPEVQVRLHAEIDSIATPAGELSERDLPKLPYLQAVIKEVLRMHPPGPLLSWARLAINDVHVAGHHVPAGTTAMVNMWAITHDSSIWAEPNVFKPERFLVGEGGQDIDIRGGDLRLAPFGAGRRVCPGRALGYATVQLWVARLLQRFSWSSHPDHPIDLSELLKLSCEMKYPLVACAMPRLCSDSQVVAGGKCLM
ncbi:hypothetical protein GOP47_0012714 [Adiantum capillus-veneris]|uniref:Cytochrome P450 n=1 Tax=Adiantum capillus-veneris TaxID=13818 RepID=A0A9D4ZEK3_ADICA|nr:hypothetical protein GOP47_0012714 [Adiantum capillus-veneris]